MEDYNEDSKWLLLQFLLLLDVIDSIDFKFYFEFFREFFRDFSDKEELKLEF